jgi:hypothetical protein
VNNFARWDYYFNRNAIATSAAVGSSLVALTEAGHLLRFDRQTFALTGQLLSAHAASALCAWRDAAVAVGFTGGSVSALDPTSLKLTPIDQVPGRPIWLGVAPGDQLVVVYVLHEPTEDGGSQRRPEHHLRIVGSNQDIKLPLATTFFIDSASRLWLGSDHGEWGGDVQVVNLKTRKIVDVPDGHQNVYGFAEVKPGEVWAHGGLIHMGAVDSYVTRLTPKPSRQPLFEASNMLLFANPTNTRWLAEAHPHSPIVHIVQAAPDRLLLLGYGEIFESDAKLKTFQLVAKTALHVSPGRPDAVGSYPAVRATHADASGLLLATAREGYVSVANGVVVPHTLPGQMSCSPRSVYAGADALIAFDMPSCVWQSNAWRDVKIESWSDDDQDPAPPAGSDEALVKEKVSGLQKANLDACASVDPELPRFLAREHLGGQVQHCARDRTGRFWLAGQGLWFVAPGQPLTAVHASLPFLTDTTIEYVAVSEGRLVLALGSRGLAILNLNDLTPNATATERAVWNEHGFLEP